MKGQASRATEAFTPDSSSNERLNPRAGHWYIVDGHGHLFLEPALNKPPGRATPVCGITPTGNAPKMDVTAGDSVCRDCNTYVYEVYLTQVG
jgi:hypothetical protein